MRDKALDPTRLDVLSLAKAGATLNGELPVAALPRLAAAVQALEAPVLWQARGSFAHPTGRDAQVRLHLGVQARAHLVCQRCLETLTLALDVQRPLRFVPDERQAEVLDELAEDEDVLALPKRLNLVELVEDELIMALPIVPRHETCPKPVVTVYGELEEPVADEGSPPHPFAALGALRGQKGGS